MPIRTRLAAWSLATAAAYLSASLWCTAPAAAQADPEQPDTAGGAGRAPAPMAPRNPAAPPDAGGILMDDVLDPAQYIVGPGDLFGLVFWGASNFNHRLRVDAQGRLFVPQVGFVQVRGMTLAAADALVGQRVRAAYPRLKHGLMLIAPRRFFVQVAGLVQKPNLYEVTALTRVSAAIAKAGGRLPGASTRRIEVRRGGKVLMADLQPFFQDGDRSQNPFLIEGDVIYVKPAVREVHVEGAVYRPGTYELTGDGTLGELLRLAGGVHADASTRLGIRLLRRVRGDDIEQLLLGAPRSAGIEGTALRHADRVIVPGVHEALRTVAIQGAVGSRDVLAAAGPDKRLDNPGSTVREVTLTVPFYDGDTVRSVLERAGGLLPWADARNASLERRDGKGTTRVPVDAYALLVMRDITRDVAVKAGDVLYVPAERDSIMVSGPVHRPGLYAYNPRYRAVDYVNLAGGPTPQGSVSGAKVITKSGAQAKLDQALVAPGDTIAVKTRSLTTFEWVQILISASSLLLSATAIVITLRR